MVEDSHTSHPPSPAETLRLAAAEIRSDWGEGWIDSRSEETRFHLAVADWLENSARDFIAATPNNYRNTQNALAVARAYLGESA